MIWIIFFTKGKQGHRVWDCAMVEAEDKTSAIDAVRCYNWPILPSIDESKGNLDIGIVSVFTLEEFKEKRYIRVKEARNPATDETKVRKRTRTAPKPVGSSTVSKRVRTKGRPYSRKVRRRTT